VQIERAEEVRHKEGEKNKIKYVVEKENVEKSEKIEPKEERRGERKKKRGRNWA
jgi:hypothetical protein